MTSNTGIRLNRRALLGAALGATIIGAAPVLRAATPPTITGIAFDGETALAVGDSLLISRDGGASWSPGTALPEPLTAISVHPARPGRVIVALRGGGIAISEDGGTSFASAGQGLPGTGIGALTTAAQEPDTLYAAIPGDGLWRSEDAGATWEFVMDRPFLADDERDVLSLASVDLASGMGGIWLYGGTSAGLQRVPDCFCRWQDVQPAHALDAFVEGETAAKSEPLPTGEPVRALVSAPTAPNRLWAALPSGIWTSNDAGVIWQKVNSLDATALAGNPSNPEHLVAATTGGLFHSHDAGATWVAAAIH